MKKIKCSANRLALVVILFMGYKTSFGQPDTPVKIIKELEAAEIKMFDAVPRHDPGYFKNYIADDFFSVNADGVTQDKAQVVADSSRGKMLMSVTYKMFDKKIRVYNNDTGIITGRAQAFMKEMMVVEFLYTAIFVKQKDKWIYTSWQGTISKDSPKPPPMPQN